MYELVQRVKNTTCFKVVTNLQMQDVNSTLWKSLCDEQHNQTWKLRLKIYIITNQRVSFNELLEKVS